MKKEPVKWTASVRERERKRMHDFAYRGEDDGRLPPYSSIPQYQLKDDHNYERCAIEFAKYLIALEEPNCRQWLESEPMPSYGDRRYLFRIGVREGSPPRGHYVLQRTDKTDKKPSGVIVCYGMGYPMQEPLCFVFYGEHGWAVSHSPDDVMVVDWDFKKNDDHYVDLVHKVRQVRRGVRSAVRKGDIDLDEGENWSGSGWPDEKK